jgi:hypothetical protein
MNNGVEIFLVSHKKGKQNGMESDFCGTETFFPKAKAKHRFPFTEPIHDHGRHGNPLITVYCGDLLVRLLWS